MSDPDSTLQPADEPTDLANREQPDAAALPAVAQASPPPAASVEPIARNDATLTHATPAPFNAARVLVLLSEQQKTAIELIVHWKTDRIVAETLGVHPKSVTRWRLYHAGFRAELARRRQEVWSIAADRFRGLLAKALNSVENDLDGSNDLVRHRAARAMLSLSRKFAPPDDPIDPLQIVREHARVLKRAMNSSDPMIEPVNDEELKDAEQDLANLLGDPEKEDRKNMLIEQSVCNLPSPS